MLALGTVAVILILWSAFSGRWTPRRHLGDGVHAGGLVVGVSALGLFDVKLESAVAERIAELALVLLLFSDAMRLDLRSLRHELRGRSACCSSGCRFRCLPASAPACSCSPAWPSAERLPAVHHARGHRRGAGAEGRDRSGRAAARAPGAGRGERAQRRTGRALSSSSPWISRWGHARGWGTVGGRQQRRGADRLGHRLPEWAPASSAEHSSASPRTAALATTTGGARYSRWPWRWSAYAAALTARRQRFHRGVRRRHDLRRPCRRGARTARDLLHRGGRRPGSRP